MGAVATAVGCAVGIPIGVGIIVAMAFWFNLQKRFKKEMEEDKELERAIYDESGSISFDNLNSMKDATKTNNINNDNENDRNSLGMDEMNETSRDELNSPQKRKSNAYIPAYRRKINNIQEARYSQDINKNINKDDSPPILSKNDNARQVSLYDQMIPFVDPADTKKYFNIENESIASDANNNNNKFMKNLQNHDLGSYYPGAPIASHAKLNTPSTSSFLTTNSSSFSHSNINAHYITTSQDTTTSASTKASNVFNSPTKLKKNNYDPIDESTNDDTMTQFNSNESHINNNDFIDKRISEEDQYENEFTNYSENRKQFLDSLRPN